MPKRKDRTLLAELPESGVHQVPRRFFRDVRKRFEEAGWRVFVLPEGINDEASFARAGKALFSIDPPWHPDVFDDDLLDALLDLPERRFAILWPDATTLAYSDSKTYRVVLDVLEAVTRDLANPEYTVGNPKDLAVVVGT